MVQVTEALIAINTDKASLAKARREAGGIFDFIESKANSTAGAVKKATGGLSQLVNETAESLERLSDAGKIDDRALAKSASQLKQFTLQATVLSKELAEAKKGLEGLEGEALDKQRLKVAKLEKSYLDLEDSIERIPKKLEDGFEKANRAIQRNVERTARLAEREAERVADELANATRNRYSQAEDSIVARVDPFGNVATGASTLSGASALAGNQQLAVGLQVGTELASIAEDVPRAAVALGELGVRARDSSKLVGGLAGGLQSVIPALGAGTAGILAMGIAIAPLIIAGGALAFVYSRQAEEAKKAREATQRAISAQAEIIELRATATTEEAQAELQTREARQATVRAQLEQLQLVRSTVSGSATESIVRNVGDVTEAIQSLSNVANAGGSIEEARQAFLDSLQIPPEVQTALEEFQIFNADGTISVDALNTALSDLEAESTTLSAGITVLNRDIENGVFNVNDIAQAEAELSDQRAQATASLAQLDAQLAQLEESASLAGERLAEDRAISAGRELEDFETQLAEHNTRVTELRTDGLAKIAQVEADGIDRIADLRASAFESEGKAVAKAQVDASKIITDTLAKESTIQQDYIKQSLQREEKFARDRLRAQQDLADTLFEGELNNDILSITLAKRKAKRDEQRATEEFDTEKAQRQQDTQERLAEIKSEGQARLREIETNLAQERAQIQANLAERVAQENTATQEAIARERDAIEQRVQSELEAQDRLQTQRNLRLDRQRQDEEIQDRRRRDDHNRQLQAINERRNAEIETLNAINTALIQIGNTAQSLINTANQGGQTTRATSNRGGRGGSGGLQPFAEGGIVPANTRVLAEFEGSRPYDEAVIPLKPDIVAQLSGRVGGGRGGGGQAIIVNLNAPIGDGVSRGEVRTSLIEFAQIIMTANRNAIEGAR